MSPINRRSFIASSAASAVTIPMLSSLAAAQERPPQREGAAANRAAPQNWQGKPPIAISSGNGLRAVERAAALMKEGRDPLEAIVAGINIVEDDPADQSVGYGGLPNENGVVQLDSSCMHGPSHKAGAVAALERIKNPSSVALEVLRRTDHALLVGQGALDFARALGFEEMDLLTPESRRAWLRWKANLNADDDWLNNDQRIRLGNEPQREARAAELDIPYTNGTIHCSALNERGELSACTSTSGLSWKLPGRVGDSPIIGAGMFCDNAVGSAGATGRGEAVIQSCGAFQIVQHMASGLSPTDACLKALQYIADHTKQAYLLNDQGRPNFEVVFYALRKDGAYGSACFTPGDKFTIHDGTAARSEECAALYG